MKNYQLKPFCGAPQPSILERLPSLVRRLGVLEKLHPEPAARAVVCIGGDLEKAGACLAIQVGAESVVANAMLSRAEACALVRELIARGWRVAVGVEACGFGWLFQSQLRGAGAVVFTFATEALTGRRKTNQRDAAALARLVAGRVVHGDLKSGRVVREPSPEEQRRRFLTRHRAQMVAHRGRIEAQGRGLIYDSGIEAAPDCWWGKKMWPRFADGLARGGHEWLRGMLGEMRGHALLVHAQILALDALIAKERDVEVEVQVIQIGPVAMISNPAEFFVEFGLELKKRSNFALTMPVELANGCVGYVPTEEALGEHGGGYETRLTSYSNLDPTAGRQFVEAGLELAKAMKPSPLPERKKAAPWSKGWDYGSVPAELK